ncbi:hypothetical protein CTA1_11384 [Colletotrichum tanaceti]|uniref:Uncharacterized protein n=1 Tax=Colletotrichum tanaceti TaxID=1306861 RepID=A0A4U6XK75_9PEZI|nr:hypothetical protein CTA1_11384 [Colletotrichum tanaceti]
MLAWGTKTLQLHQARLGLGKQPLDKPVIPQRLGQPRERQVPDQQREDQPELQIRQPLAPAAPAKEGPGPVVEPDTRTGPAAVLVVGAQPPLGVELAGGEPAAGPVADALATAAAAAAAGRLPRRLAAPRLLDLDAGQGDGRPRQQEQDCSALGDDVSQHRHVAERLLRHPRGRAAQAERLLDEGVEVGHPRPDDLVRRRRPPPLAGFGVGGPQGPAQPRLGLLVVPKVLDGEAQRALHGILPAGEVPPQHVVQPRGVEDGSSPVAVGGGDLAGDDVVRGRGPADRRAEVIHGVEDGRHPRHERPVDAEVDGVEDGNQLRVLHGRELGHRRYGPVAHASDVPGVPDGVQPARGVAVFLCDPEGGCRHDVVREALQVLGRVERQPIGQNSLELPQPDEVDDCFIRRGRGYLYYVSVSTGMGLDTREARRHQVLGEELGILEGGMEVLHGDEMLGKHPPPRLVVHGAPAEVPAALRHEVAGLAVVRDDDLGVLERAREVLRDRRLVPGQQVREERDPEPAGLVEPREVRRIPQETRGRVLVARDPGNGPGQQAEVDEAEERGHCDGGDSSRCEESGHDVFKVPEGGGGGHSLFACVVVLFLVLMEVLSLCDGSPL